MLNSEKFIQKFGNFNTVYLAGGIQSAKMPNSWRSIIGEFLIYNNKLLFNPVDDNSNIFNQSILGYRTDGTALALEDLQDYDELKEAILLRQTELNDKKAIQESDLIFFFLDDRIGHGTMKEFDWAYDWKKPIIIVRTISRRKLAHWNKWRRYFGLMVENNIMEFKTLGEVKEFFVQYFNFKEVPIAKSK